MKGMTQTRLLKVQCSCPFWRWKPTFLKGRKIRARKSTPQGQRINTTSDKKDFVYTSMGTLTSTSKNLGRLKRTAKKTAGAMQYMALTTGVQCAVKVLYRSGQHTAMYLQRGKENQLHHSTTGRKQGIRLSKAKPTLPPALPHFQDFFHVKSPQNLRKSCTHSKAALLTCSIIFDGDFTHILVVRVQTT